MNDAWIRWLTMSAIVLLVLHAVGSWAYSVLGIAAAVASAALVAIVSLFSARMAIGRGNNAWFVVPTVLFTAPPLVARSWTLITAQEPWWTRMVEFAPFLIGFAAPVFLLLAVYLELAGRARVTPPERAVPALLQRSASRA